MLVNKADVIDVLRCPITHSKLKYISSSELVAEEGGAKYEIINECPILVDFNKSVLSYDSIVRTEAESVIQRKSYSGISKYIKQFIYPAKEVSSKNAAKILNLLSSDDSDSNVLIIGGGTVGNGMQPFYDDSHIKVISFDIYSTKYVQFVADAHNIPLPSNYFDCVIIQAVLEHVVDPHKVVSEIHRILKKGGLVYSETPFLQHVHEGAYDFTRFTESGHRYLFKKFELIKSGAIAGAGTQLVWSIDFFFRSLFRSKSIGKLFKIMFFWLQYADKIIPEKYAVDAASGVYFLGRKNDNSIYLKDIISHYQGAQ